MPGKLDDKEEQFNSNEDNMMILQNLRNNKEKLKKRNIPKTNKMAIYQIGIVK